MPKTQTNVSQTGNIVNAVTQTVPSVPASSATVSTPMNSADVRAMILDKYAQTIASMKTYFSATYPDYPSLATYIQSLEQGKCSGMNVGMGEFQIMACVQANDPKYSEYTTDTGAIYQYINNTFSTLTVNFCDLNQSILVESDRVYCHGVFDFNRSTNSNALETSQKVHQDLQPW